jgi:hypothetical protein
MSEDLKDILSNLNPDIDQETLLLYLQGKLSPEKQHDVEKKMMDDEFHTEAMEGLQEMKDKRKIAALVEQLNKDLKKRTEKKKRSRKKMQLQIDPWLIIAIVLILLIAVIAYVVVHKQLKS